MLFRSGADGDVGDEVAIHDVDVEHRAAGGFERGDGVGEACEVGGEDGGENLGHGRFMLAPEAASEMD